MYSRGINCIGINFPSKLGCPPALSAHYKREEGSEPYRDDDDAPARFLDDLIKAMGTAGDIYNYPWAVFGHSAGATTVKALLDRIDATTNYPSPTSIFLSAVSSPSSSLTEEVRNGGGVGCDNKKNLTFID